MRLLCLVPLLVAFLLSAPRALAVEITVERADALLAERDVDPWERSKDASVLAWNEAYVIDALLDLHEATGDAKYLDEFVCRADRILSHRDDARGFADASGKVHKRWSIGTKYTVAEAVLVDAAGRASIRLRSTPSANNHVTKVRVEPADDGAFTLRVSNKVWKRTETLEGLSVEPSSERHFPRRVNHDAPLPKPPAATDSAGPSLLLRATPGGESVAPPVAQEVTLTPLWHAHVGYVGILYHPMLKFALRVKGDASLSRFRSAADRYVAAAEESYAEIRDYWRDGPGDGEGYYIGAQRGGPAPYDNVPQAMNYQAKQACSELALHQLTGKPVYLDHATRIGRLLKNRLEHRADGDLYVWKYWYEPLTTGWTRENSPSDHYPVHAPYDVMEDASHATLEVGMITALADAGVVFDAADVRRVANTFLRNVAQQDRGGFNAYVDGTDGPAEYQNAAVFGWLPLAAADREVYAVCREIYVKRGKDDLKSVARLLKWERVLRAAE